MNKWLAGARPRTLPAAIVPVLVGTACAHADGEVIWWRALAALVVSLAIQVGTNYANDYSDGIRGTDEVRVGPVRLVASGLAPPRAVKQAALASFGVAAVVGLAVALAAGWPLLAVGAASIAAGWFYTGGSRPYGYAGLGEVFVFVFFGLVAVVGSAYVHLEEISAVAVVAAVPVGLLSVALLLVNNLRDVRTDADAGKRTLAVRIGDDRTRLLYALCIAFAFASLLYVGVARIAALLAVLAVPFAVPPLRAVLTRARGSALVKVLGETGRLQLVFGVLLAAGIWIGP